MHERPITEVQAEVERRFGVLPNFFRLAPDNPDITASLWGFARFAYLDNPLPSLLKNGCSSISPDSARYATALRGMSGSWGLGRPSGDDQSSTQTVEDIIRLIRRPLHRSEQLEPSLAQCAAFGSPLAELPTPDTSLEEAIFACATHVFLQTPDAPRCLEGLRRIVGNRVCNMCLCSSRLSEQPIIGPSSIPN